MKIHVIGIVVGCVVFVTALIAVGIAIPLALLSAKSKFKCSKKKDTSKISNAYLIHNWLLKHTQ
jgi:hypothetical protein